MTYKRRMGPGDTGSGGAPVGGEYALATPDAGLPAGRVLTDTATVTWDFSTPGTAQANAFGPTNWLEAESSVAPNNIRAVVAWLADSVVTNADAVIAPKGSGSFLLQIPDGTIANGDKRGLYAVDLQRKRALSPLVAQGDYTFIGNGDGNAAVGLYCCIVDGVENSSFGSASFVGAGEFNVVSTLDGAIGCGYSNQVYGNYGFIGAGLTNGVFNAGGGIVAGESNYIFGDQGFIGAGVNNQISGYAACIVGGEANSADADYTAIPGGAGAASRGALGAYNWGGAGPFGTLGDSQLGKYLLKRSITGASAVRLTADQNPHAANNQITLPNNSAYVFTGEIIARDAATGNTSSWRVEGLIKRGATAATTTIVGTPSVNIIDFDIGASSWSLGLSADTALGCLAITVAAAGGVTIRAIASIKTTELA